jgi:hypothetical protein
LLAQIQHYINLKTYMQTRSSFFYLAASVFGFGLQASNILHVDLSGIKFFFIYIYMILIWIFFRMNLYF